MNIMIQIVVMGTGTKAAFPFMTKLLPTLLVLGNGIASLVFILLDDQLLVLPYSEKVANY